MGKKVFISGIAGFLGSNLAEALLEKGCTVVGCDNMLGGYPDNIPTGVEFFEHDCLDFEKMKKITRGVDVVYHCAATAHEGLSVFSPNIVSRNVFSATVSLLTAAIQNKVSRFIFFSSMARYGNNNIPFREEYEPKPCDPYGIAKVSAELILRNLCGIHGMEYVIVVPHDVIGPRQKYDDPFRNVASIMINLMLQGRQPIIYGDGEQKRCFSDVRDCIQVLEKLIEAENVSGEIINIGPDEEFITINQLANEIAKLLNFKLDPVYVKSRPAELKRAYCSSDKARRLLNYKTNYTLRQSLMEIIEYIKKRGPLPFSYYVALEIVNEITPRTWVDRMF